MRILDLKTQEVYYLAGHEKQDVPGDGEDIQIELLVAVDVDLDWIDGG
jgi:hypothetical protein